MRKQKLSGVDDLLILRKPLQEITRNKRTGGNDAISFSPRVVKSVNQYLTRYAPVPVRIRDLDVVKVQDFFMSRIHENCAIRPEINPKLLLFQIVYDIHIKFELKQCLLIR